MALGACTAASESHVEAPKPSTTTSPVDRHDSEDELLASVGGIGELTWRCKGERTKLVRFAPGADAATEEVTVMRGSRKATRTLNPGGHLIVTLTPSTPAQLRIVQATEPATVVVRVRLSFGAGRRCLVYVRPSVSVHQETHPH